MEWTNNDWNCNYLPLQARILVKTYLNPRDFTTLEATTWGENTKSKERCLGLLQRCKIPGPMELLRILHLGFKASIGPRDAYNVEKCSWLWQDDI